MSNLVERLRAWHRPGETITGDVALYLQAADEIERLQRALARIAGGAEKYDSASHLMHIAAEALRTVPQAVENPT